MTVLQRTAMLMTQWSSFKSGWLIIYCEPVKAQVNNSCGGFITAFMVVDWHSENVIQLQLMKATTKIFYWIVLETGENFLTLENIFSL